MANLSKSSWFWVSLASLCLLISIAFVELLFFYPKAQRYFENSGNITAQPLTARSREYLHNSLELITASPLSSEVIEEVGKNLDLAYGHLNVNLYLSQYPCASTSLGRIDNLSLQLVSTFPPTSQKYTQELLKILKCFEHIEIKQDMKKSSIALSMLENLNYQRQLLAWGALFALIAGLVSVLLHLNQSKVINQNKKEKNKWLNNALRDALTGALNRRAFDEDLPQYLLGFNHQSEVFSVLMCDIDYFKQYNDSLGHVQGDKALQVICHTLSSTLNSKDKLYRYGGEEIVILLSQTDHHFALKTAQQLLIQIQNLQLPHPTSSFGCVTISIGCATIDEPICNGENIVEVADQRLYQAKQGGRNQIVA